MKVSGAKIDTHIDQARYLYAKDKAIDEYKIANNLKPRTSR